LSGGDVVQLNAIAASGGNVLSVGGECNSLNRLKACGDGLHAFGGKSVEAA
jgi:hypothetical protein